MRKIFTNAMSQHSLKDDCRMLQNHAWLKDPFKVQYRPMGATVTDYGMFS